MGKSRILTQSHGLFERLMRHRWTIGLAGSVSALGMATALAVGPVDSSRIEARIVVEDLGLENARALPLGDSVFLREERVRKGDTVGSILARLGMRDSEAQTFIATSPAARVIHQQLAPGKIVSARTNEEGNLLTLYFPLNGKDSALVVEREHGKLSAQEKALRFETQTVAKTAEIRNSLFGATDAAGIPDGIATQLAEIFGSDIDFHRDLRKNDRFTVIYEMQYLSGQPARSGRIIAAEFINDGKSYRAIHFPHDGRSGYYTAEGKSLKKAFLRSPLEFSRVTSGFAMRFHPILQEWRAHKGVDYGAPVGTSVRATGDGVVEFAGQQGGYGNMVVIGHSGQYSTAYGHLKGFATKIRKGVRVAQGETIGYVGQTGWATGPHLHYEFRIASRQVNPLGQNLPMATPLENSELALFRAQSASLTSQLDLLRQARLSALE